MTVLAATCGLTTTTTRNNLPHAIPKREADQQKNNSSKRVHCEIPHTGKVPAVGGGCSSWEIWGAMRQPRTENNTVRPAAFIYALTGLPIRPA